MSIFFTKKGRSGDHRFTLGFTLIELLVVIAIIGVLASIVLASLNSARRKSRDARRITDLKQIQLALELYFDAQGSTYPVATATCTTPATTGVGEHNGLQALVNGGYIPQISRDPGNAATCYRYGTPTAGPQTTYHLGATIEEATNPALSGDKDQAATASGWTNDFNGGGTGANGDSPTAPIYDVVP